MLAAIAAVPRDRFLPRQVRSGSDRDVPLRIGEDQTTSQPSLIASMLAALGLTGHERVLEVGTGTGYQAALLGHLAAEVHTIERHAALAAEARRNLDACGLQQVRVHHGDGTRGVPEHAPFHAIIVAAATAAIPAALAEQLVDGGRLVAPVGSPERQEVQIHERREGAVTLVERATPVRFVPLVSEGADQPDGRERPGEPEGRTP